MAKKRPRDAVQFTLESAERIANVVRSAEVTPPAASPLTFDRIADTRMPKAVRAAVFSGSWPIGSSKTVTFSNAPTTTATVQNLSWPITEAGYSNEPCIVGKDGTAWYLVVPRLQTATSVFVTATQQQTVGTGFSQNTYVSAIQTFSAVTDVSISAQLNTSNCAITIGKTVTTTEIRIVSETASAFFASGTSTATVIAGTATASFLRIRVP